MTDFTKKKVFCIFNNFYVENFIFLALVTNDKISIINTQKSIIYYDIYLVSGENVHNKNGQ